MLVLLIFLVTINNPLKAYVRLDISALKTIRKVPIT